MNTEKEKKAVSLSVELYNQIDGRAKATGFDSVEEYVTFVMEEVLKNEGEEDGVAFSEEEEEEVKKRLRSLGYLD